MNKHEKLRLTILAGNADASIPFDDLCGLLVYFGFQMRTKGSHHVFSRPGVAEQIVLPRHGRHIKRGYVRDVRRLIEQYHLGGPS